METDKRGCWQLQEAKNRLSEVVRRAEEEGPQVITVRGREAVVVVARSEYERYKAKKTGLAEFLLGPPWRGSGVVIERADDFMPDRDLFGDE
jgi:prevent-host-death family protein